jgi:hypothetical protein
MIYYWGGFPIKHLPALRRMCLNHYTEVWVEGAWDKSGAPYIMDSVRVPDTLATLMRAI